MKTTQLGVFFVDSFSMPKENSTNHKSNKIYPGASANKLQQIVLNTNKVSLQQEQK